MEFIFFILASLGICFLIVDGKIFNPVKMYLTKKGWNKLVEMLNCPQCFGFHSGLLMGTILDPSNVSNFPIRMFCYGCIASFLSYMTAFIIDRLSLGTNE